MSPDEADLDALFGPDQVLTALPARERQIRRPVLASLREIGQDGRVLVVGVGADIKDGPENGQLLEGDLQLPGPGDGGLLSR